VAENIIEQLGPKEKAILFETINYTEDGLQLKFPDTYQELDFSFRLDKLIMIIEDVFVNVEICGIKTT
jgi:hypothetical protein